MDAIDKKLLGALVRNGRTPITALAKRARVSREVAAYRLRRLEREEVILKYITRIDTAALGFVAAALFVSVRPGREGEFKNFLRQCPYISWVAQWTGAWSFGMTIVGRTNEEVDDRFHDLYDRFKADIVDHRFAFHKHNHFFHEKFIGSGEGTKKKTITTVKIDELDKKILKELSLNARVDYVALSKNIALTAQAIRQRIKRLEKAGVIERYSIFLNIAKLGLQQYSVFARVKDVDAHRLVAHLGADANVSFIAEYVGDPFLEFGLFVKDPYELRPLLRSIEAAFPEHRVMELSLFEETIASIGPPRCVFE